MFDLPTNVNKPASLRQKYEIIIKPTKKQDTFRTAKLDFSVSIIAYASYLKDITQENETMLSP